jgi:hypothetical protein
VNNKEVSKDTGQDLVLAPCLLLATLPEDEFGEISLRKMLAKNRTVKCENTKVVITVTERSERDLTK